MKPKPSARNLRRELARAVAFLCAAIAVGLAATAQAQTGTPPPSNPAPSAGDQTRAPAEGAKRRSELDPAFGEQDPNGDGSAGDVEPDPDRGRDRNRDRIDFEDAKAPSIRSSVNQKAIFDSDKPARLKFEFDYKDEKYFSERDIEAKVELKRRKSGAVLERWNLKVNGPEKKEVKWKGISKGKLAKPGRYQFELTPLVDGDAVKMSNNKAPAPGGNFNFYTHVFPVQGKHDYGQKGASFGAGRGGRKHLGQDLPAKCGTPLVAARGGKIQANQFQDSAGFYLVIDGNETDEDYVYYHMKKRSKLRTGEKVKTGEVVGQLGSTGNATGCILHFERWTKPGWFEGGKAYDPRDSLESWDKYS